MFGFILMITIGVYCIYEGCLGIMERHKKNKEE